MAIPVEVRDMAKQVLGRDATAQEISGGSGKSVGELADWLRSGAGGGASGVSGGGGDFQSMIEEAKRQNEPLVEATRGSFATERERLEGQVEPTKQRYQDLLNEVTQTASAELGKRGIPSSSTFYDEELQGRRDPTVRARESALSDIQHGISGLTAQENQAIAGINAGAVPTALNLFQAQESARQNAIQNQLLQQQVEYQPRQFEYELNRPYFKTDAGGGGGMTAADFLGLIGGGGGGFSNAPPVQTQQAQTQTGFGNILASGGVGGYQNYDNFNWNAYGLGGDLQKPASSRSYYTGF